MEISGSTKIHDLLKDHPFLEDFLVDFNPKFELLRSRAMRATIGRVASLKMAASVGGVELDELLSAIAIEIRRVTGEEVIVGAQPHDTEAERAERIEVLKGIIRDLHDGADPQEVSRRGSGVTKRPTTDRTTSTAVSRSVRHPGWTTSGLL